jgi:hypothetical protein
MSLLTLTPTQQARTGTPVNLTALLAAGSLGSNTGVEFTNSGREVLYVQQGTAASTIVVNIGSTVEGEPVTPITYSGVVNDIQVVGPFNADEDFQPGAIIEVTFGTAANVTGVALVENTGTY